MCEELPYMQLFMCIQIEKITCWQLCFYARALIVIALYADITAVPLKLGLEQINTPSFVHYAYTQAHPAT